MMISYAFSLFRQMALVHIRQLVLRPVARLCAGTLYQINNLTRKLDAMHLKCTFRFRRIVENAIKIKQNALKGNYGKS